MDGGRSMRVEGRLFSQPQGRREKSGGHSDEKRLPLLYLGVILGMKAGRLR